MAASHSWDATQRLVRRRGLTLIELLLVVSIVGLLAQLLVPAVQAAREAARRTQCANHLRQLALAATAHEVAQGHLPTGGWGMKWVGDPDRGFGSDQPGGWAYNLLPYLEQQALHDLPQGKQGEDRLLATAQVCQTPLPLLHCPTRRSAECYPYLNFATKAPTRNSAFLDMAAKLDYAASAGDYYVKGQAGPKSTSAADLAAYEEHWLDEQLMTGVVFQRSRITSAQITDGKSHTYLFGEKQMDSEHYRDGLALGDDQTAWTGFGDDTVRFTRIKTSALSPTPDYPGFGDVINFGSNHPAGCQMAYCDGSIRFVSFWVSPDVHRLAGARSDGNAGTRSQARELRQP